MKKDKTVAKELVGMGDGYEQKFEVGCVLNSDTKGVRTPIIIFGSTADGMFKVADENNSELQTTFDSAKLIELGYAVMAKIDITDVVIKPCKHKLVAVETKVGDTTTVTMTKVPVVTDHVSPMTEVMKEVTEKYGDAPKTEVTPEATPEATPAPKTGKKRVKRGSTPATEAVEDKTTPKDVHPPTVKEEAPKVAKEAPKATTSATDEAVATFTAMLSKLAAGRYSIKIKLKKKTVNSFAVSI